MKEKNPLDLTNATEMAALAQDVKASNQSNAASTGSQNKPKVRTYSGHLYKDSVQKTFRRPDPNNPSKTIVANERYHFVDGFVTDRITGWGISGGLTKTMYMTFSGQYDDFGPARITIAGADHYELVKKELANVTGEMITDPVTKKRYIPLKEDVVFEATVTPMGRGRDQNGNRFEETDYNAGYNVVELWRIIGDERKPIFVIQADKTAAAAAGNDELSFY